MQKKRLLMNVCVSLGFIFLLNVSSHAGNVRGVTEDVIKIGVIIDLTGPTSNIGTVVIEAYRNFIRHLNDQGGVHGRKIKLTVEDDRYSIPAGIAAFKKLVFRDQVLAIMGPMSTAETKTLLMQIERNKMVMLPWAPDESVRVPYKRYVFPGNGFYSDEFGILFNHIINELKAVNPKIALCYPDVEAGKLIKKHAEDWASFYRLKLHMEVIPLGLIDVTSQILSMKRAEVTHVLIFHVAPGIIGMLKDMRKFGLDIPSFGLSPGCTEDVVRIAGKASGNYKATGQHSSWYEDYTAVKKMREISLKYNPDAEKAYGFKLYSFGWLIATILEQGLRRAGKDLDGEKLADALETLKDFDTGGLSSPVTYTPTMHHGLRYNKLFRADPASGRLVPITDWVLPPSRK
ncbi:MAG: ABC transporter substrate-binding protein [Thermodesulfobacteriota bacterium]